MQSLKTACFSLERKIPLYVFFELTRKCNLRCRHCYVSPQRSRELSLNKIKDVIRQLKDSNSLILNFSGGEIFSRGDFFPIAFYAKKQGFAVKLFTNGTLINAYKADQVADLNPLRVEVTIFSLNPKIHDGITGIKGSLRRSLNALSMLAKRRVSLRIKSTLMKDNAYGYKEIIKFARGLGAKYQFDPIVMPKLNNLLRTDTQELNIDEEQLEKILKDRSLGIQAICDYDRGGSGVICSAGHNSCAISAYGDVFPCIIIPLVMGNLNNQKFRDIWENSPQLNKLRLLRFKDLKDCPKCRFLSYCNRCPGHAYLFEGDLLNPPKRSCMIAEIVSRLKK